MKECTYLGHTIGQGRTRTEESKIKYQGLPHTFNQESSENILRSDGILPTIRAKLLEYSETTY